VLEHTHRGGGERVLRARLIATHTTVGVPLPRVSVDLPGNAFGGYRNPPVRKKSPIDPPASSCHAERTKPKHCNVFFATFFRQFSFFSICLRSPVAFPGGGAPPPVVRGIQEVEVRNVADALAHLKAARSRIQMGQTTPRRRSRRG